MPMKNPPHPGRLVKENIEDLRLSVADAAQGLAITRQQLYTVIGGKNAITPAMAARLVKSVSNTCRAWLGRGGMAEAIWRRRAVARGSQGAARGDGEATLPCRADELRHLDARSGAAQIRLRGAEAKISPGDRPGRNPLVPGLFGTQRRLRSRLAADQSRGQGRSFPGQRPEHPDLLTRPGGRNFFPAAPPLSRPHPPAH